MFTNKNLFRLAINNILIAGVAIVITICILWFLSGQIVTTSDTILKNRQAASNFGERTSMLFSLRQDAALVGQNDVAIDNALMDSDNILQFVDALTAIATKYKVVQTFAFDSPTSPSVSTPIQLYAINYNTKITSNLSTLENYLSDFEKLPYFTQVNGITITSQDKSGWDGSSFVNLNATLFTKVAQ